MMTNLSKNDLISQVNQVLDDLILSQSSVQTLRKACNIQLMG